MKRAHLGLRSQKKFQVILAIPCCFIAKNFFFFTPGAPWRIFASADFYLKSADFYLKSADFYQKSADFYQKSADFYLKSADFYQKSADFYQKSADFYRKSADFRYHIVQIQRKRKFGLPVWINFRFGPTSGLSLKYRVHCSRAWPHFRFGITSGSADFYQKSADFYQKSADFPLPVWINFRFWINLEV